MNTYIRLRNFLFGGRREPREATDTVAYVAAGTGAAPAYQPRSSFIPLSELQQLGIVYWQECEHVCKWLDQLSDHRDR